MSSDQYLLGEDMIKKITKCSRLQSALGVVKKTKLIQCVRQRPCLWDHKCEDFKYTTARQNAFLEIVKELSDNENQYTRTQMQEEWGKIRYCFTRIMKKLIATNDDADAVSWPHWEDMQFMYDQIKENLLNNIRRFRDKSSNVLPSTAENSEKEQSAARKRRHAALPSSKRHINENISSPEETDRYLETRESISRAAANALYHLGLQGDITAVNEEQSSSENPTGLVKTECLINTIPEDNNRASTSASPATERPKWDAIVTATVNSKPDTLSVLMFENESGTTARPQTNAHFTNSAKELSNNTMDYRSSLSSIENNATDGESDTNDFFGKYMIQQMKTVSRRNPTLGVLLRKELMEVCCKYELQIFS